MYQAKLLIIFWKQFYRAATAKYFYYTCNNFFDKKCKHTLTWKFLCWNISKIVFWIGSGGANIKKENVYFWYFCHMRRQVSRKDFFKSHNLLKYNRSKYFQTNKNEQIIAPVCCIIKQLKYVFPKAHCLYQRKNFFVIDSSFAKMSRCQKFWNYFIVLQ